MGYNATLPKQGKARDKLTAALNNIKGRSHSFKIALNKKLSDIREQRKYVEPAYEMI